MGKWQKENDNGGRRVSELVMESQQKASQWPRFRLCVLAVVSFSSVIMIRWGSVPKDDQIGIQTEAGVRA